MTGRCVLCRAVLDPEASPTLAGISPPYSALAVTAMLHLMQDHAEGDGGRLQAIAGEISVTAAALRVVPDDPHREAFERARALELERVRSEAEVLLKPAAPESLQEDAAGVKKRRRIPRRIFSGRGVVGSD